MFSFFIEDIMLVFNPDSRINTCLCKPVLSSLLIRDVIRKNIRKINSKVLKAITKYFLCLPDRTDPLFVSVTCIGKSLAVRKKYFVQSI